MERGPRGFSIRQLLDETHQDPGNGTRSYDASSRLGILPQLTAGRTYGQLEARDNSSVVQGDFIQNTYYVQTTGMNNLQRGAGNLTSEANNKIIRDSLSFPRMGARLLNIEQALPDTCQWFFYHEKFTEWRDAHHTFQHHGFLWLKGKPGSGKSTIMKLLYKHANTEWPNQITISYFFNGRAPTELEKSSLGLYRSLVYQILEKLPSATNAFMKEFAAKIQRGSVEEWTQSELKAFLFDVVTSPIHQQIWNIFIDALDEGSEDDVRQMINYFERLAAHAVSSASFVRICLSSRHYPHISIRKGLQIILENQKEHTNDIRTYLRDTLSPGLGDLEEEVCRKSAGVFLWVILVVQILKKDSDEGASEESSKELLDSLPSDLTDLFKGILTKSTKDFEDCISLLQWVLFSQKPLTPKELYVAIHYSHAAPPSRNSSPPDDQRLHKFLLHHSRGLVEMTNEKEPLIQFIHETVRSFLLGTEGLVQVKPSLAVNFKGQTHQKLERACSLFIKHNKSGYESLRSQGSMQVNVSRSARLPSLRRSSTLVFWPGFSESLLVFDTAPFVEYAVNYWLQHADAAQECGLFEMEFPKAAATDDVLTSLCLYKDYECTSSILDVAAREDLKHLVQSLIDAYGNLETDVRIDGQYLNDALQNACDAGSLRAAQVLLDNGTGMDEQDEAWVETLERMLMKPVKDTSNILRLLHRDGFLRSRVVLTNLLKKTVSASSLECIQLLLEIGADPNVKCADGRTLLVNLDSNSIRLREHTDKVQLLLKYGADANSEAGEYGSVLQLFSFQGFDVEVEALLKSGAQVNVQSGKYGNALMAAVCNNRERVVRLLLEHGADANAQGVYHRNALDAALQLGYKDIVLILLQRGARVPVFDISNNTQ